MEDVRIGRRSMKQVYRAEMGTDWILLVPPDPLRYALILCAAGSGTISFSTDPNSKSLDGIRIAPNGPPIVLNVQHHGDLARCAWYADHSAGGVDAIAFASTLQEV